MQYIVCVQFDMLLGQLLTDGTRRPGAIDKFKADMSKTIAHVAKEAENKGQLEDAVKLYDLAAVNSHTINSYDVITNLLAGAVWIFTVAVSIVFSIYFSILLCK